MKKVISIIIASLVVSCTCFSQEQNQNVVKEILNSTASLDSLQLELKSTREHLYQTSEDLHWSAVTSIVGTIASVVLAALTWDKESKTFSGAAYIPMAVGNILSVVSLFEASNSLEKAGKNK